MTEAQMVKRLKSIHWQQYQGTTYQAQDLIGGGWVNVSPSSGRLSLTEEGREFVRQYETAKAFPNSYEAKQRRQKKQTSSKGGKKKKYSSPYEEAYYLAQEDRVGFVIGAVWGLIERFGG